MTQKQFDIIHEALGYALRRGYIKPEDYDLAIAALCKEHPELEL
jgi:hypothetical protein